MLRSISGSQMQLDLMLQSGRAFEVRAWLEPEHETVLGFEPYHWLRVHAAAACGDYAEADAELDQLSGQLRQVPISPGQFVPVRSAAALRRANERVRPPSTRAQATARRSSGKHAPGTQSSFA